ncbi:TetR/AcrR family transcriptional regulator [Paragemmobacter straminiformis]|uniref:TetR/AcrR family transcriptional regulator n=1 Tax=Paragemmobacter straminiformis TaxID=2045119 RepID=A0A842I504_9RHOB|nr:TetR/AcrR family transcriptional regulator [Gemmobacter straminiformis]MBC2834467.1 TetR/AcrR family transcriptional regulator [Gemmobacter straminiformis]
MPVTVAAVPQTIRRGRKFDQVLAGARTVFLRDGFEGASVDDIAREAGVSKATLYSYFPDKRLLFMEVAKAECRRHADEAAALIDETAHVSQVLRVAGLRIVGFAQSDFGQRMFRMCVAESDRFPALGQEFYQAGPMVVRERLVGFLERARARGEVRIEDLALAADQFAQLCKADLHDRVIFGISDSAPRDVARVVEGAVAMFMARYGV